MYFYVCSNFETCIVVRPDILTTVSFDRHNWNYLTFKHTILCLVSRLYLRTIVLKFTMIKRSKLFVISVLKLNEYVMKYGILGNFGWVFKCFWSNMGLETFGSVCMLNGDNEVPLLAYNFVHFAPRPLVKIRHKIPGHFCYFSQNFGLLEIDKLVLETKYRN